MPSTELLLESLRYWEGYQGPPARPHPLQRRGPCPRCGGVLVSNLYKALPYGAPRRHALVWECWNSLGDRPTCIYRTIRLFV